MFSMSYSYNLLPVKFWDATVQNSIVKYLLLNQASILTKDRVWNSVSQIFCYNPVVYANLSEG